MNMHVNTDIAWLAGLVDGEGCLSYYSRASKNPKHNRGYTPRLSISMFTPEAITKAAKMVGAKSVITRTLYRTNKRTCYTVNASGPRLRILLEGLLPYLTTKKEQAEILLDALYMVQPVRAGRLPGGAYSRLTEEDLALREGYNLALKAAKRLELEERKGI